MTQEANDDINATIMEAEESILRIAEELGRMKTAAELLDESGKRSQLLQDALESLVTEIGSLVEVSGRVIDILDASEIRGLVTQMRTVLSRRMDGLRTELLENTKTTAERVGAELQTVLIQRIDSLGEEIDTKTESVSGRVGSEMRTALTERMDRLENELANGTRIAAKQVCAEVLAANERIMIDSDLILKRLDVLSRQVAKLTEVAEKTSKRKGIFSRG